MFTSLDNFTHATDHPQWTGDGPTGGADRGLSRLPVMVLEVALIDVRPGQEDEFAAAYAKARELVATTPGCRSVRMTRGIESPSRFVLLVEWDSVEAHLENFRNTDRFPQWRGHIGPYFAAPPVVEHFTDVAVP
jgi:heme-degrading monooxygenase HmoA